MSILRRLFTAWLNTRRKVASEGDGSDETRPPLSRSGGHAGVAVRTRVRWRLVLGGVSRRSGR